MVLAPRAAVAVGASDTSLFWFVLGEILQAPALALGVNPTWHADHLPDPTFGQSPCQGTW